MSSFEYDRPATVAEACAGIDATRVAYAGGTDLLPRIKSGLTAPSALIDVKRSGLSDPIVDHGDRVSLGALVTLADVERDPIVRDRLTALTEAAQQAATPQIRNRATIAGNLLQRPRCWYYRAAEIDCWLTGGDTCPARDGRNEHHAIYTDGPCVAVHPSDLAGALVALDATVHVRRQDGERQVAIADLFTAPVDDHRRETTLRDGEIVTGVDIGVARPVLSTYRKAMDRAAWAFALVGVAVALDPDPPDDGTGGVRIVLTGVANTPRRALDAERVIAADGLSDAAIEHAAAAAITGAVPLSENRYKMSLAVAMTRDALVELRSRRDRS